MKRPIDGIMEANDDVIRFLERLLAKHSFSTKELEDLNKSIQHIKNLQDIFESIR